MQYCIVATNNGYFLSTADELHSSNSLGHHGIKGQRWYHRRWQNEDGTLTEAGKIRYRKLEQRSKDAEDKYKKAVVHTPSRAMRWNDIGIYAYDKKMRKINSLHAKSERAKAEFEKFKESLSDDLLQTKLDNNYFKDLSSDDSSKESTHVNATSEANKKPTQEDLAELEKELKDLKVNKNTDPELLELVQMEIDEIRDTLLKTKTDNDVSERTVNKAGNAKGPEYLEKVKTSSGDTRYIYDKDELKAYKDGRTGASDADLEKAFKKMRNTAKTGEEVDRREDAWDRARDKDLWDLNFLEAVQNSVALKKGDTKTLLTEYAYYLADPEQYWQDRDKHLKDY